MVKYPNITANIVGGDGNAFAIIGTVKKAMQRGGVPNEVIQQYFTEAMSGDYDNVIQTSIKYVNCE